MTEKHVLFVDDNPRQRDLFRTAVQEWNDTQEDDREFIVTLLEGYEQANEALERTRFDCALFDLRLPSGKKNPAEEPSGNSLARAGLHKNGIPVGIISGKPGDLDEEFQNSTTVRLFFKGDPDPYGEAVKWFAGHWEMMEVLAASRRKMRGSVAELFALRVWPQWAKLPRLAQGRLTDIVTRQYVTQMAELLGLDDPANAAWHPFENYVTPALQEGRAHTGDIFDINGELRIVLSPQCDMATKKIDNAILALCNKGAIDGWDQKLEQLRNPKSQQETERSLRYFKDFVNQNVSTSVHFLPPLPGENEPFYVQFQNLITAPLEELNNSLASRRASVSPPFLSNLVQRFGSYIARTGQPNIDVQQFK